MSLRLKTCQFAFPALASLTNNTLTNLTQITVHLPESTKTIRKAWVDISMDDITTTAGNITTKTVNLRLGGASYTSTTNANALSNSGENISLFLERDFTTHFTTNWTGTSMTCDVQLQINQSTGATLGMVNVCCILNITYEYDDAATTQLKTVWIPLNAPTGALPTTKTSHDTIPNLSTYLPENSKTFRNIFIVAQGNSSQASTTDHTITFELSSLGTQVTGNYEAALASDRWTRYVWNITSYITTNTTHTFNMWSSLASRHFSMQTWMVVTYEFNATATTSVMNSLIYPMEVDSPFGGPNSSDFQRADKEFFIEESNPVLNKLACFLFWQNTSADIGLNARIGTGSFIAYSSGGLGQVCGNKGLMIRNDSPTGITIGRGRNDVFVDIYNTSTTLRGGNIGGFWIVNYTSDKHSEGAGVHNHTVFWPVYLQQTEASSNQLITTADAISIPETNYFITGIGLKIEIFTNGVIGLQGLSCKMERLTTEGGLVFERAYADVSSHDAEVGLYSCFAQVRNLFQRFPGDQDSFRLPLNQNRRYILNSSIGTSFFNSLTLISSYHSIPFTVSGNIANSNGGTVSIDLCRYSSKERVLNTSRVGNGPYSFTWYDNTEPVYTMAYENDTYKGISASGLAV